MNVLVLLAIRAAAPIMRVSKSTSVYRTRAKMAVRVMMKWVAIPVIVLPHTPETNVKIAQMVSRITIIMVAVSRLAP